MLRDSTDMVFQLRIGSVEHKRFKGPFPRLSRNVRYNQTKSGLCWQEVKDVVYDNTIIEGGGWYFSSIDSLGQVSILVGITTYFVEVL